MAKSILYRLFKIGGIPNNARPLLEKEGITLSDEGIRGAVITKNFRAQGKYQSYRIKAFSGSLVITRERIIAYSFKNQLMNTAFDDEKISALRVELTNPNRLEISFDVSEFHEGWQGMMILRFNTSKAQEFYSALMEKGVSPV